MKNLFLGLVATVMFSFNGYSSEVGLQTSIKNLDTEIINANGEWKKALLAALASSVGIEIQFGQNTVINGVRYSCINGGTCYIKVNRTSGPINIKDLETNSTYLVKDSKGTIALIIPNSVARSRQEFDMTKGVFVSDNDFPLSKVENLDQKSLDSFKGFTIVGKKEYQLEQLDNHVAILLN
jgi:hypothetical protein